VFDRVPPELITGIITEVGVVKPAESITIIKKYLGGI
jgi:translation initiation factor 2B subunit (eIF-2B alpha/beta/delta family)